MRAHGWKVPGVLLAAALVWGCGGDAESAPDSGGESAVSSASADVPEGGWAAAAPGGAQVAPEADARPSVAASRNERSGLETPGDREDPIDERPVAVVRTDPQPSVAVDPSLERRPDSPKTAPQLEGRSAPATPVGETDPGDPGRENRSDAARTGAPDAEVAPAEGTVEAAPEPEPLTAPVGTLIPLTVDRVLSTRTDRTGDDFRLTVSEDVLGGDGVVLLPRGTRVRGRVLESFESPGSDRPATLAVGVESVEIGGRMVPMAATVTELEHETEARDSDGRSAAKVGAGAVAGALLGKIIGGDGRDALKGAVAGAIAGAAVAHATRDGHAVVPEGARMVVVLDQPLVVEGVGGGPT